MQNAQIFCKVLPNFYEVVQIVVTSFIQRTSILTKKPKISLKQMDFKKRDARIVILNMDSVSIKLLSS